MQSYLETYPSLVPLGEVEEGASELLCIGREVGVLSGSVGLLFIDADGMLTEETMAKYTIILETNYLVEAERKL